MECCSICRFFDAPDPRPVSFDGWARCARFPGAQPKMFISQWCGEFEIKEEYRWLGDETVVES